MKQIKHRKNLRLSQYDYRSPGYYYVTICSHNRACIFGEIAEGAMMLSEYGQIVDQIWRYLPEHFLNVSIDRMQIMPNHVHAILIIEEEERASSNDPKPFLGKASLGQMIGYWKYQSTKTINIRHGEISAVWQPNMFEHIIRNERELQKIRIYIENNPGAWFDDIENPVNLAKLREAEAQQKLREFLIPDLSEVNTGGGAETAPLQNCL